MTASRLFVVAALLLSVTLTATASADAADCPRAGTLGTAREMVVDPAATPRVGLKNFPQTLALADKEVVLTFDDGPSPPMTVKVLKALADQCVRATFFLVGQSAAAHPALVKQMAAAGHTIGHHTYSHSKLPLISDAAAAEEIDRGIAADEAAQFGNARAAVQTPFFRFPYFASTPALLDRLERRGIAVFGADLWASDWEPMTPQAQLELLIERLQAAHKGIILLHDPRAQTVAMLPDFLRYLRDSGYKVVHLVPPAASQVSATAASVAKPRDRD